MPVPMATPHTRTKERRGREGGKGEGGREERRGREGGRERERGGGLSEYNGNVAYNLLWDD